MTCMTPRAIQFMNLGIARGGIAIGYAYARADRVCFLAIYDPERVWFLNLFPRKGTVLKCQMCASKGMVFLDLCQ